MAKFGKQKKEFKRAREVDSTINERTKKLKNLAEASDDQIAADVTIDNLALAMDKNSRVMDVAAAIAEEEGLYIDIPSSDKDQSQEVYMVRNALIQNYPLESESGSLVRWDLFKKIVDNAAANQDSVVEYLANVGSIDDQMNEIKIGHLANILNGNAPIDNYVDNKGPADDAGDPEKDLWKKVGIAFLSYTLMSQFHKLSDMFTSKRQMEEAREEAQPTPGQSPQEATSKTQKLVRTIAKILARVAEAVILFALAHKLTKTQTQTLANIVVPPGVDPELKEEFFEKISEMYDNPPSDISNLLVGEDGDDETIFSYCMKRIDMEKEQKNFTPWVIYAMGKIRSMNLNHVSTSLAGTSNEPDKIEKLIADRGLDTTYSSPTFSIEKEIVKMEGIGNNLASRRPGVRGVDRPLSNNRDDVELYPLLGNDSPIRKYQGKNPSQKFGFNIMDYISEGNAYAEESGKTSNYFMHLMQNNNYTPELVCCLLRFLVDDIDYLKNLRDMLKVFGKGMGFNWGDMLEDMTKALFNDLRSAILSYAISELAKAMGRIKESILEWMDHMMEEEEYVAFCTPLLDMAQVLLQIINDFEALLEDMIEEIVDALFGFELEIEGGVMEMNGSTRYRNIIGIIDAIVFALEQGRLCDNHDLAPTDIHPDALPIIEQLSSQPRQDIQDAIAKNKAFSDALNEEGPLSKYPELRGVGEFVDPDEPWLRTSVSLTRANNGESAMETIARFAPECAKHRENMSRIRRGIL